MVGDKTGGGFGIWKVRCAFIRVIMLLRDSIEAFPLINTSVGLFAAQWIWQQAIVI